MKQQITILVLATLLPCTLAGNAEFDTLIETIEADVLELAREVEQAYENRCSDETFQQCPAGSYDECVSQYPFPTCPGGLELSIPACGVAGGDCGGLFDYSISTTRLPNELADGVNRNPTDKEVIETVCYTNDLDDWFQERHQRDASVWRRLGVESPSKMFGARNGVFRIYPARHSRTCGDYDPRKRPWYIAASSGPKNLVLVLDTSGSMSGYKMDLLKQAAKLIVSTLTVADRVAIVQFSGSANVIADNAGYMFTATAANKQTLLQRIDRMIPGGQTNFYDAFSMAFVTLENTIRQELHVDCNSAILFLTDGKMTTPEYIMPQDVIDLVSKGINATQRLTDHPVMLLTYSVSEDDGSVHKFPKDLACAMPLGVWSKIVDEDNLVDSLTSYYLLFALGLGHARNEDFVAWVEPYRFFTNDQLGTSAAAPAYDRSVDPNVLIGVVGYDLSMSAFDAALGVPKESQVTLDKIVLRSTAKCPELGFTLCELESFRKQGTAGVDGLCFPASCNESDYVAIEPEKCPFVHDYPKQVFDNAIYAGKSYADRVCCKVGESMPSDECPPGGDGTTASLGIILGAVGGTLVVVGVILCIVVMRKRRVFSKQTSSVSEQPQAASPATIVPVPPPAMNPSYLPSAPPSSEEEVDWWTPTWEK